MGRFDVLRERARFYWRRLQQSDVDDMLERGLVASKEIRRAIERPSPYTVLRAGMASARVLNASDLYWQDALPQPEWRRAFPTCIKEQLLEILNQHVTATFSVSQNDTVQVSMIRERDGENAVRLAWTKQKDDNVVGDVMASSEHFESSVAFARDLLWRSVDSDRLVVSSPESEAGSVGSKRTRKSSAGQVRVSTDDLIESIASAAAREWQIYLRRYLDAGVSRTVLFYGLPGVGKSCLSRSICQLLDTRYLRIRVEDVYSMGTDAIADIINIFEPDAVIFDDLDRSTSQVALLEMMEVLHRRVKIVFATVNHLENLNEALKRPGRFDEIVFVGRLDDDSVRALLGPDNLDVFDRVREWPVAFIQEYLVRRRVLGTEEAIRSIDGLRSRVDELMKDYDPAGELTERDQDTDDDL